MRRQFTADSSVLEVDKFVGLKLEKGNFLLKTRWLGFYEQDDTWEPLQTLAEDIPNVVIDFLSSLHTAESNQALALARQYSEATNESLFLDWTLS